MKNTVSRTRSVPAEGETTNDLQPEGRKSLSLADGERFELSNGYSPLHAFQASSRKLPGNARVVAPEVSTLERPESEPAATKGNRGRAYPARTRVVAVPKPLALGGGNCGRAVV